MTRKVKAFGERVLGIMQNPPGSYKKSKSGLLIADEDMDPSGIKPRWFEVYSVGEKIDWIKEGQYVYVAHGRWTRGMDIDDVKLYMLDNKDCMLVSDEKPEEDGYGEMGTVTHPGVSK